MRNLEQLQYEFQAYLLNKTTPIQSEVVGGRVPVETRLDIYRSAYYLRLKDALFEDYGILAGLMGEKKFSALIDSYIRAYPSQFRSLRFFGKSLPLFMAQSNLLREKPWLIEIAQFEWLLTDVFDALNMSTVSINEMAKVKSDKWPLLRFELHPTVTLIEHKWNSVLIFHEWKTQQKKLRAKPLAQTWLVWRKTFEVLYSPLAIEEVYMIQAIKEGKTFSEVCEGLCEWIDESQVAIQAATLLKRYISDGIFSTLMS